MKPVRLAPEAVRELADEVVWYESRNPGLAPRFLQEFEAVLRLIESRSASFPRLLDTSPELNIRRALASLSLRFDLYRIAFGNSHPCCGARKASPWVLA